MGAAARARPHEAAAAQHHGVASALTSGALSGETATIACTSGHLHG